jgi:methyl-accepting chemotaxis protein
MEELPKKGELGGKNAGHNGKNGIKIRYKITFVMCLLIFVTAGVFSFIDYREHEAALVNGIDAKLLTAAHFAKALFPDDYHDNLDESYFTLEEYDRIVVDRNNRLSEELGFQYIWSNMVLDNGEIVFTSSTSPNHRVEDQDHAKFFEVHSDPEAFDQVRETMEISYYDFENEWGHGKMILVPYVSEDGRPYFFGVSISVEDVRATVNKSVRFHVFLGLIVLVIGVIASFFFAYTISKPIVGITKVAQKISQGDYSPNPHINGTRELNSLSRSMNRVSTSLRDSRKKLGQKMRDLERFAKVAVGREERMIELKKKLAKYEKEKKDIR